MKRIVIFTLVFLVSLICVGCVKSFSRGKWTRYKSLKELWPRLKNEKIESICFCDEDPDTDVESWYVCGGILRKDLGMVKELLGDGFDSGFDIPPQQYPVSTCQGVLRIITNKGKYVTPVQEHIPQNNWREHVSLVAIWPRLQKEKIERISFCNEILRVDIDSWACRNVPKVNLDECIRLIGNAMRSADPNHFQWGPVWQGRIKIITDKGKYLVPAETDICKTTSPRVFGNEWSSAELGECLKKCGFCNSNSNQPSQKPSE